MARKSVARRNRVLYEIRASPLSEFCKHHAAHIFMVRANHLSRGELTNRVIPAMSHLPHCQRSTDDHFLLPVQPVVCSASFHCLF